MERTDYNGWKNRQTWNIALWIGNEEPLYRAAYDFMRTYKGRKPYKDFVRSYGLTGASTPDRVSYTGTRLDYHELNNFMRDLIS